ncbi:hypothetical protein [Fischerella sp. PCC 9605]|uniref:hypothetical protein n=1 Tax=Fischerella sp. PCC 9605 TaxID=1173024 RepID=UPI00047A74F9|nr:hypothetical protein [Fischerella sp. PCC 9605]
MKTTTVSISYSRKFNLGDYESIELGCSLWAQVDEDEDSERVTEFLYLQAKQAVKEAAMPVIKASEYQQIKVKQQKRFMNEPIEEIESEDF